MARKTRKFRSSQSRSEDSRASQSAITGAYSPFSSFSSICWPKEASLPEVSLTPSFAAGASKRSSQTAARSRR